MVQLRKGLRIPQQRRRSADVFAHYSAIASSGYRSLEENQKVQFDVVQGPKGPRRKTFTRSRPTSRPESTFLCNEGGTVKAVAFLLLVAPILPAVAIAPFMVSRSGGGQSLTRIAAASR
ncbi:probable cold shock protein A [Arthrobacter sp. Hiyo6]|nr:probable cold shock protein A [Arthrobacter sp. Hiyo6]